MTHLNLPRWGAVGAWVAGIAWALSGVVQLAMVYPNNGPGEVGSLSATLIESLHAIAEVAMIVAFVGLRACHRPSFGLLGNIGFWLGSVGLALMAAITIGVLVAADAIGETVASALILPGFLTMLVWIPLMGIAAWRAKKIPRWCALLLILHPLFFVFLLASYGIGGIALGMLWLAVGYALWSQSLETAFGNTNNAARQAVGERSDL